MRILCVHEDGTILERYRRALLERERGWEVRLSLTAEAALDAIAQWKPDAVVAGQCPPALDGTRLLGDVRDRHPETVRILVGGGPREDMNLRALRVAHRVLPSPCEETLLIEALRRTLLLRDLVGQPELRALLGRLGPLPAAPSVYAELTRRLEDPHVSLVELGELVAEDAALAAQVLRIANSAYFGRDKSVSGMSEAAARVGTRVLRSLVLTAEVFTRFPATSDIGVQLDSLQRHSSLVARIASSLEPRASWGEDAFTAGLLHDVGKLVLLSRVPDLHASIVRQAVDEMRSEHSVEAERLGAHHATLGACLLGMWGLPSVILEAVNGHHDVALEIPHSLNPIRAVALANRLAHDVIDAESERERRAPLPMAVVTDPRWSWWREMADQLAHELAAA